MKTTKNHISHLRSGSLLAILVTLATTANSGDLKCFPVAARMAQIYSLATAGPDGFSLKGYAAEKMTSRLAARGLGMSPEEFKENHPEQYQWFADEALTAYKEKITDTSSWYREVGRRCLIRFNQIE